MEAPPNAQDRKQKKLRMYLYFLLCAFFLLLFFTIFMMKEKSETYSQNFQLKTELDHLMGEYSEIKEQNFQFQQELSERDSIILANSIEIDQLINSQADYRKVKRKLDLLRKITQDYVARVDSLIVVNEELTVENLEIKKEITQERRKNEELSKVKGELDKKVTQAAVLKAYNLRAMGVRVKGSSETDTEKAVRTDKVSVRFTLSENTIIAPGPKVLYVRVARPDGIILCEGEGDDYSFKVQGESLQYSMKREINYTNAAQDVQVAWLKRDRKSEAMTGVYNVSVFADGQEIGRTAFVLK